MNGRVCIFRDRHVQLPLDKYSRTLVKGLRPRRLGGGTMTEGFLFLHLRNQLRHGPM